MKNVIVAGIGTEVGKTVVSAILAKKLGGAYWKPISCGSDDSDVIRNLGIEVLPEVYTLPYPISPHANPGVLREKNMQLPHTKKLLVIEMAGGVLVPFNEEILCVDLFKKWEAEWIVVVSNYIGNINHTLLTLEALFSRGIPCRGLVFNGDKNESSERAITKRFTLPILGRVKREEEINQQAIERYSKQWKFA